MLRNQHDLSPWGTGHGGITLILICLDGNFEPLGRYRV